MADRVAVMHKGHLHQVDTPTALYAQPSDRFVATFVGEAQLVEVEAPQGASRVDTHLGVVRLAEPAPGGLLELAIRPEQLRLARDGSGRGLVAHRTFFGHDQVIEVTVDDSVDLRARLDTRQMFRVGERVSVSVAGPTVAYPHTESGCGDRERAT